MATRTPTDQWSSRVPRRSVILFRRRSRQPTALLRPPMRQRPSTREQPAYRVNVPSRDEVPAGRPYPVTDRRWPHAEEPCVGSRYPSSARCGCRHCGTTVEVEGRAARTARPAARPGEHRAPPSAASRRCVADPADPFRNSGRVRTLQGVGGRPIPIDISPRTTTRDASSVKLGLTDVVTALFADRGGVGFEIARCATRVTAHTTRGRTIPHSGHDLVPEAPAVSPRLAGTAAPCVLRGRVECSGRQPGHAWHESTKPAPGRADARSRPELVWGFSGRPHTPGAT
jgi:hypothetical protein